VAKCRRDADGLDIAALSGSARRAGQLFVTHRVVELHRWEQAANGELIRSFEYLGERGADHPLVWPPQEVERNLGLPTTDTQRICPSTALTSGLTKTTSCGRRRLEIDPHPSTATGRR